MKASYLLLSVGCAGAAGLMFVGAMPSLAQVVSKHDSNAPVNFTADRIEVQDRADRVVVSGNVEVTQAGMTLNDFRNLVCEKSGDLIACDTHLVIHVESNALFANLNPPTPCLTDGKLTPRQGSGSDGIRSRSGDASMAVVVTACYDWQGGMPLFQFIWNLLAERGETPREQKMVVLSAATAFRSEPFE